MLRDQDQLTEALLDLPGVVSPRRSATPPFGSATPLDDGHATERVLDALWPRDGSGRGAAAY